MDLTLFDMLVVSSIVFLTAVATGLGLGLVYLGACAARELVRWGMSR
jgi:hypothetical protein